MTASISVIYHDECRDGFGAAWAAFQALGHRTGNGNPVHYIPSKYGQKLPETDPEGFVYILDFSYNLETMTDLYDRQSGRIRLLDHHKTAMEELQGQVPGCHFDMTKSGAVLAWDFFKPFEKLPALLAYVQDRDLWQWQLPHSRQVNAALQVAPLDFELWSTLEIDSLRIQGEPLVSEMERQIALALETALVIEIDGVPVPAVEVEELVSETAERLLELNPNAPFVAIYHHSEDHDGNPVTKYSLRSADRADVSDVARRLGGGGHPNAAGFIKPRP